MPDVCANLDGEAVCMPVDLTVFTDPRQGDVPEQPGEAPGGVDVTGGPVLRTRLPPGAAPEAWPRGERLDGQLVKGQERIACELLVRSGGREEGTAADELLLIGDEVFRAIMGRAP